MDQHLIHWMLLGQYPNVSPKGGKVTMRIYATKGTKLYFVVGGGGGGGGLVNGDTKYSYGGYNGGGSGGIGLSNLREWISKYCGSGGGGATTVAISLNGTDGRLQSYGNETTASKYVLGVAGGGGGSNHGRIEYAQSRDSRGGATNERNVFGIGESGGNYSETECTIDPFCIEGSGGGGRRLVRRKILHRSSSTK